MSIIRTGYEIFKTVNNKKCISCYPKPPCPTVHPKHYYVTTPTFYPANIYLFNLTNRNTRKRWGI